MPRTKLLAAAALSAALALPATAQEIKLSAINFLPNDQIFGAPLVEFADIVNKEGKGAVQVEIRPYGAIPVFEMGNAVKGGVVDIASVPGTFIQNLLPVADVTKLIQRTPDELRQNGGFALLNALHNQKVNVQIVSVHGQPVPFHIYLRDKKIEKADLTGLKLRITPVYRAFFRALGGQIVVIAPAEVLTALERGTVDGYGWPLWDIKSGGWDKFTKYRVDPGFYYVAGQIMVNLDKWKQLKPEAKALLNRAGLEADKGVFKKQAEMDARYKKEQADAGVQVITLQGAEREKYIKTAYDAGWAELEQLDAENTKKLKPLLSK